MRVVLTLAAGAGLLAACTSSGHDRDRPAPTYALHIHAAGSVVHGGHTYLMKFAGLAATASSPAGGKHYTGAFTDTGDATLHLPPGRFRITVSQGACVAATVDIGHAPSSVRLDCALP